MASQSSAQPGQIEITSLPLPQLRDLKSQLDAELTHLSNSFTSLRTAQSKFRDCLSSLANGINTNAAAKPLLVPLTSSLYVPGQLTDAEHVLVDVGTGFFVEKDVKGAEAFYERKVKDLGESLRDLEGVIQGKAQNVRVVEEVMRVKVLSQQEDEGKGKGS
ncbi:hypothetical protein IAQ61_006029 [Plenodomus lingam]|uniref:Prefoldin subunit 5 n=1 Tax=Leptosphaeria maculans (strain JN3 / isolate v23.1.3 / race Av1-4-5-6-7-8) TaxID=985895 RepID=E4ZMX9_LEPMJ|nr:hypothetical protein LEMA_P052880.1 [Plenodomus lingam JN3]KAH9870553.1 hypothetical protein IAQ61_006029 [Plenodomus lingam]CBX92582.1 hypothetical protein LEMA_P052880.1 [Plenodomus lingam JN3]